VCLASFAVRLIDSKRFPRSIGEGEQLTASGFSDPNLSPCSLINAIYNMYGRLRTGRVGQAIYAG